MDQPATLPSKDLVLKYFARHSFFFKQTELGERISDSNVKVKNVIDVIEYCVYNIFHMMLNVFWQTFLLLHAYFICQRLYGIHKRHFVIKMEKN